MADKTYGFKVSEDLHEKVQMMIESSPLSAKEWFEKAVALVEINAIKEGSAEYTQDINELEVHTIRIYELVTNMIQRSIYLKESALKELSEKVEQKENIISEYHIKVKTAGEEKESAVSMLTSVQNEKDEILKQLHEVRSTNENNQALISEYKEKIDSLSGLLTKYQGFANENEQLKEEFSKKSERLKSQVSEVMLQNDTQQGEIKELKRENERLKQNYEIGIERIIEKKDFEKDKALLESEKEFQSRLAEVTKEHNIEIKKLYDEMARLRKEYDEKIEKLNKIDNEKTDKG